MSIRANTRALVALLALVCSMAYSPLAYAQLIRVEAGASDLLPSQGGSVSFQGPNYAGYFGAGDLSGSFGMGASLRTTFHSEVLTLGDQPIAFDLPTDIFATNHFYPTRGLGISGREGRANVFLFVGGTATVSGTPFFQSASADRPVAMLFTDAPLSSSLHVYSKSVISARRTSIESIDWHPRKWFCSGLSGGIGSNQPYLAVSSDIEKSWLSLKAEYVSVSDRFRRITVPSVYASEVTRENIVAVIKPESSLLLTLGHENLLQPTSLTPTAPFLHATVNQAQSTVDFHEFRFGAGIFQSMFESRSNMAEDLSVSRRITNSFDVSVNQFRTLSGIGPHTSNLSASLRETISPRLSLLQVVNYSQGRATVLYGGSYLSNRFAVGVDYQTLYLPFRTNPFSQGISVSLRIRLFAGIEMNAQTFRSSSGQLRYTASGNSILAGNFRTTANESAKAFKHLRYVVRGCVRDENGTPVEGAAVLIGQELVLTNVAGEFFLRRKNTGVLSLQVSLEEFMNAASFRVIAAPATVTPGLDGATPEIVVILGRN